MSSSYRRYAPRYLTSSSSYYRRRTSYIRRGPYRALISSSRHTHPVYPRPELKHLDTDVFDTMVLGPSTVGPECFNGLAQGTGGSDRVGLSITNRYFVYNISLAQFPTAQQPVNARIVFFWDKQPNGAVPTAPDVMADNTINSFLNMSNKDRFVVLRNHYISLSPNGTMIVNFHGYISLNMQSQYDDSNSIPRTGALFALYVTDSDDVDNDPFLYLSGRLRYYDN